MYWFCPHISKITLIRYYILAPVMIVLIFFATFNINRDWHDFIGLLAFGLIGITFKNFGWSRPALLIGFFFLKSRIIKLSDTCCLWIVIYFKTSINHINNIMCSNFVFIIKAKI